MITEHLMRPGNGSLRFVPDVPMAVTEQIRKWVDENAGGPGAHVVITPSRLDPVDVADAGMLAAGLYTGVITDRPTRLSLEFAGLGAWLDSYLDSTVSRSAGTPSQWLGDLLRNGLTAGTVTATGTSNVSRTFPAHSVTARQALDKVAELGGWEYELRPDFTVDAAIPGTLFREAGDSGTVVVTAKQQGQDDTLRGVDGSLLDQALTQLGPSIPTKAVALGQGVGVAIAKGTATRSLSLKTRSGGTPELVTVFSVPSEDEANADTAAAAFLNLQGMRRQVNVASRTEHVRRHLRPGDEVYAYDLPSGLFVTTDPVSFHGEQIFPITVRLLTLSWPIEAGLGVYVRSNAASPVWLDVTDWVEFETGTAFWTVGDWNPPSYGPVNRSNPEIEERAASPDGAARILLSRATAMSIGNGGGGTTITWGTSEAYVSHVGGTFKAGSADVITIPADLGGDYLVAFSGEFAVNATGVRQLWITIGSNSAAGELSDLFATRPAQGTLPDRLALTGAVRLDAGSTLTAKAYQNSGGALNLSNMRLSAIRLGS